MMHEVLNAENLPHSAFASENILMIAIMENDLKNDCFL